MPKQFALPAELDLPEALMREAHRRLRVRSPFEKAVQWPALKACLMRSAARLGRQGKRK